MNLFGFLCKARAAEKRRVARERLQILLAHDARAASSGPAISSPSCATNCSPPLRVTSNSIRRSFRWKMERSDSVSTLEIDVEIPRDKQFVARTQASAALPGAGASKRSHGFWP